MESAFGKYLREYRLLNSLLLVPVGHDYFLRGDVESDHLRGDRRRGDSDFSDGGAAPAQQQQEKQKVVKLMQRQQKTPPTAQQTFRTTAISDITLPDFNELDVKDLSPVVNAASFDRKRRHEQRRHEERPQGHWLVTAQDHATAAVTPKRLARLRSGGGRK